MTLDDLKAQLALAHPQIAEGARLAFLRIDEEIANLAKYGHIVELQLVQPQASPTFYQGNVAVPPQPEASVVVPSSVAPTTLVSTVPAVPPVETKVTPTVINDVK